MSGKLKFLLAVLAAGAGFSFWYMLNLSLSGPEDSSANVLQQVAATDETCGDTDGDGLCDYDETYWESDFKNPDTDGDGFKDGEEVLAGHDPAKAGPNDLLNDRRNLTERTGSLLLGGLVTGSLDVNSPDYQASVDALVNEIFEQYDANVAVELDSIALASGSLDGLLSYSLRMTQLLRPLFAEIMANHDSFMETLRGVSITDLPSLKQKNPAAFAAFVAAADAEATAFGDRARAVKAIRVPPQMLSFHRSLLLYLRGAQRHYLSVKTVDRDPLLGLISLQVLQTLSIQTPVELAISFQNQAADAINSR